MTAGAKLAIGTTVVAAVTAYMAYVGASASWKYYLTADECVANSADLIGERVRVSGEVAADSLRITPDQTQARFSLKGAHDQLDVVCSGTLPDNLADGSQVVVEGQLEPTGTLRGDKILTRCASKYETAKPLASRKGDSASVPKEAP